MSLKGSQKCFYRFPDKYNEIHLQHEETGTEENFPGGINKRGFIQEVIKEAEEHEKESKSDLIQFIFMIQQLERDFCQT